MDELQVERTQEPTAPEHSKPQPLQKLHHIHEMIVLFMMENPWKSQKEVAEHFTVTPSWLSQIINCDMFQARIANYRSQTFEIGVLSIHEKLAGAASLALDKLTERLDTEPSTQVLLDTANKLTQRLGHGSTPSSIQQVNIQQTQNVTVASREHLAQAREIQRRVKEVVEPLTGESDETLTQGQVIDASSSEAPEVGPSST